jgi:hypothetical protein
MNRRKFFGGRPDALCSWNMVIHENKKATRKTYLITTISESSQENKPTNQEAAMLLWH